MAFQKGIKMLRIIWKIFLLYFLLLASLSQAEEEWIYTTLTENRDHQVYLTSKNVLQHIIIERKPCENEIDFYCYEVEGFSLFAIPKKLDHQKQWINGESSYKIKKQDFFNLLGQRMELTWIERELNSETLVFLYSKKRGVVAFFNENPKGPLFLLQNYCGFAADSTCSSHLEEK